MKKYWKQIGLRNFKNKLLITLLAGSLLTLNACSDVSFQNPFNPSAQLRVVKVESERGGNDSNLLGRVGIFQQITQSTVTDTSGPTTTTGTTATYTYSNPTITLQNLIGLPGVTFNKGIVRYKLSGAELPLKEFPINLTVGVQQQANLAIGGTAFTPPEDITIPMLSIDDDVKTVVFPGNSLPKITEGLAELLLIGKDFNGNEIKLEVPIPLRFASNQAVNASLTPNPTPTAIPAPTATAAPTGSGG